VRGRTRVMGDVRQLMKRGRAAVEFEDIEVGTGPPSCLTIRSSTRASRARLATAKRRCSRLSGNVGRKNEVPDRERCIIGQVATASASAIQRASELDAHFG
jgi:hypothetical protein